MLQRKLSAVITAKKHSIAAVTKYVSFQEQHLTFFATYALFCVYLDISFADSMTFFIQKFCFQSYLTSAILLTLVWLLFHCYLSVLFIME